MTSDVESTFSSDWMLTPSTTPTSSAFTTERPNTPDSTTCGDMDVAYLEKSFLDETSADCIVKSNNSTSPRHAHTLVLSQSPRFAQKIKERRALREELIIIFVDYDYTLVYPLLEFFYKKTYGIQKVSLDFMPTHGSTSEVIFHAQMYGIATEFEMEELKTMAYEKLHKLLWVDLGQKLKVKLSTIMEDLFEIIRTIYFITTERRLRHRIIDHMLWCMDQADEKTVNKVLDMTKKHEEFGHDLIFAKTFRNVMPRIPGPK